MKETQAYIERIRRVNREYQRLDLAVDDSLANIQAGQALLVRRIEKDYEAEVWDPYLRELWFPVEAQARSILVVEQRARQPFLPGQLLSIIGPVGSPIRLRQKLRNILLIAHDSSPAALLFMLSPLLARDVSITLVLMGAARQYEASHLPEALELIRAEDNLGWNDMVMTLGWADQIFALGTPGEELASFAKILRLVRSRRTVLPPRFIYGMLQRQLPCGLGACHACMVNTRQGHKLQCVDGPAFDLTTLRLE